MNFTRAVGSAADDQLVRRGCIRGGVGKKREGEGENHENRKDTAWKTHEKKLYKLISLVYLSAMLFLGSGSQRC